MARETSAEATDVDEGGEVSVDDELTRIREAHEAELSALKKRFESRLTTKSV